MCQEIANCELRWTYSEQNRIGDHIWWIGDVNKFKSHHSSWRPNHNVLKILQEIYEANLER